MPALRYEQPSCRAFARRNHPAYLAWALLVSAVYGCAAPSEPPGPPMPPDPPARAASATVAGREAYWPVALSATEGQIEVYQPQPETKNGDVLTARAAVSLTRPGTDAPGFGTVWFTARIATDRDTRMVMIRDVTTTDVRVPGATAAEQQEFARAIGGRLAGATVTCPLDQLMASLDTARREQIEASRLETAPPHILF